MYGLRKVRIFSKLSRIWQLLVRSYRWVELRINILEGGQGLGFRWTNRGSG